MAVLQMQRISICALKKDRKSILETLQRRGVVRRFSRLLHQLVDIQTVALRRRNAAGGGVRLFQKTHFLQLAHLVADGGGGTRKRMPLGQCLGADWLGCADIIADDGLEDLLFSFRKLHLSGLLSCVKTG